MKKSRKKPVGTIEVKAALIAASVELFSDRGIKQVTIRDIANAANVNSALISRHFGGKNGLVEAVMRRLLELFNTTVESKIAAGEEMLTAAVDAIIRSPETTRVLAHIALEGGSSALAGMASPFMRETIRRIEQDQKAGNLKDTIDARVLLGNGFAFGLGWVLFSSLLTEMTGMEPGDSEKFEKQINKFWDDAVHSE